MKNIKKFKEMEEVTGFDAESLEQENDEIMSLGSTPLESEHDEKELQRIKNNKIEKFESYIDIHIDNIENMNISSEVEFGDDDSEFDAEYEEDGGCGCCDSCSGEPGCYCGCEDCKCDEVEVEIVPMSQILGGVSESLKWHLDNNKPVTENIFRPGSDAFFEVIKEARKAFDLGGVNLCAIDKELFESSEIGNFGLFNGELVPLDLPMESIVETNQPAFSINDVNPDFQVDVMGKLVKNIKPLAWAKNAEASCITFEGEVDGQSCKCRYDDGQDAYIFEAKYHDKEVKLNYPMRNTGSGKKYYVYVKNPKTGKVKKISFGDVKGGLTAKVSNPKARKSFSSRMNCPAKKDKTTAGYWACRINKFGHLWNNKSYPGFW